MTHSEMRHIIVLKILLSEISLTPFKIGQPRPLFAYFLSIPTQILH